MMIFPGSPKGNHNGIQLHPRHPPGFASWPLGPTGIPSRRLRCFPSPQSQPQLSRNQRRQWPWQARHGTWRSGVGCAVGWGGWLVVSRWGGLELAVELGACPTEEARGLASSWFEFLGWCFPNPCGVEVVSAQRVPVLKTEILQQFIAVHCFHKRIWVFLKAMKLTRVPNKGTPL